MFGDYRQNLSSHWSAGENQTPAELAAMRRQTQQAMRAREAEQRGQWATHFTSHA